MTHGIKITEKFVLNKLKNISQGNLKLINYDEITLLMIINGIFMMFILMVNSKSPFLNCLALFIMYPFRHKLILYWIRIRFFFIAIDERPRTLARKKARIPSLMKKAGIVQNMGLHGRHVRC